MARTCPTCAGTGILALYNCPQCFGSGSIVEDGQGLTVSWGGVYLGTLVNVQTKSPTVSLEDVTGLNSPVVSYGTHTGMVRQLIAGDITPGKATVRWIGLNGLSDSMIGQKAALKIEFSSGAYLGGIDAILLSFDTQIAVNNPVDGSAEFQFLGV
jgi:hypothetical protein